MGLDNGQTIGAKRKVLLVGGPDAAANACFVGGFMAKLDAAGARVEEWRQQPKGRVAPLPAWCEGVVGLRTFLGHTEQTAVQQMAKAAGVPYAMVEHKWSHAEPVLRVTGILPMRSPNDAPVVDDVQPGFDWNDASPPVVGWDPALPPGPDWISATNAAETLGISRSDVAHLTASGALPPPVKGRAPARDGKMREQAYYREADVLAVMEVRERAAKAQQAPVQAAPAVVRAEPLRPAGDVWDALRGPLEALVERMVEERTAGLLSQLAGAHDTNRALTAQLATVNARLGGAADEMQRASDAITMAQAEMSRMRDNEHELQRDLDVANRRASKHGAELADLKAKLKGLVG